MRNVLLVVAAALIVAGAVLFSVPLGLAAAGVAVGAIAWLSE